MIGTIYLLHFDRPYKHARHYLGWCKGGDNALERRLEAHRGGRGARLMEVITQAGIGFTVARTWPGQTRTEERRIKRTKCVPDYCPICRTQRRLTGS